MTSSLLFKINDPIYVYDTTGLYTDPNYEIDIEKGECHGIQ